MRAEARVVQRHTSSNLHRRGPGGPGSLNTAQRNPNLPEKAKEEGSWHRTLSQSLSSYSESHSWPNTANFPRFRSSFSIIQRALSADCRRVRPTQATRLQLRHLGLGEAFPSHSVQLPTGLVPNYVRVGSLSCVQRICIFVENLPRLPTCITQKTFGAEKTG